MLALNTHGQPLGPVRFLIGGDEGRAKLGTIFATLDIGNGAFTEKKSLKLAKSSKISIANGVFIEQDIAKASTIILSVALNTGLHITVIWSLNGSITGRSNSSQTNAPLTLNPP